ncbi:hypothetical protein N7520_006609 [Penicillium odoratum]|uniref:uncharacterized protein n=1 Tax=Penicillium odoratum TaxID=1167516 RepID=UPI002547F484|nr:uncharacterized protein N7520_006609 [Penicillium odoratum]KAJ5759453.1 hypothetical protein N7520_006609 [Penicillium odoratum]
MALMNSQNLKSTHQNKIAADIRKLHELQTLALPSTPLSLSINPRAQPIPPIDSKEQPDPENLLKDGAYGLTVISDPEEAIMDIVLVHGLMGDAYRTWLHEGRGVYWPRDLLCSDFKDARIMVFGYEVNVWHPWSQVSQGRLSGYASHLLGSLSGYRTGHLKRRPLVFIAHSLGGLVVQQALITSRESRIDYLRQIETHTNGICFLGTPHCGTSLATWGERAARVLNVFKPVNHQIVSLLDPRSEALYEMRRAFHNVLEKRKEEGSRIKVVCFYETKPLFRSCVVSEQSATIDGEPSFPIFSNHMGMAKFSNRRDDGYKSIVREITHMISDSDHGHLCPRCGKPS